MEKEKYYSLWFLPGKRWGRIYYSGSNANYRGRMQNEHNPFLLSLYEAKIWLSTRLYLGQWEVREVPNSEELADQERRRAHADKYM